MTIARVAPASWAFDRVLERRALPADCAGEAAMRAKEQSELPRLEVASPADRPPYCITRETVMAFAARADTRRPPPKF